MHFQSVSVFGTERRILPVSVEFNGVGMYGLIMNADGDFIFQRIIILRMVYAGRFMGLCGISRTKGRIRQ